MANSDAAFGLKPVRYVSGAPYNGACNKYHIPATDTTAAYYVGGLVKLAGSADADGVPTVTGNISAGDVVVGVIVSMHPDTADSAMYRVNSTARYVYVADDPNLLFEVQEDSDGGALAATNVGQNADIINHASGSTVTGRSTCELDSNTANTTATLDVSIHSLANRPDNVIGNYAKWLVRLNNHQFIDGTTGI